MGLEGDEVGMIRQMLEQGFENRVLAYRPHCRLQRALTVCGAGELSVCFDLMHSIFANTTPARPIAANAMPILIENQLHHARLDLCYH